MAWFTRAMQMQMQMQTRKRKEKHVWMNREPGRRKCKRKCKCNSNARNEKNSIPFICICTCVCVALVHTYFSCACRAFALRSNGVARMDRAKRKCRHKRKQAKRDLPAILEKNLTEPSYLTFLAFAFYVWTPLAFALAFAFGPYACEPGLCSQKVLITTLLTISYINDCLL